MRRVPTYYKDIIEIIGANPGHVIGSTACLGGFLPAKILQYTENPTEEFYNKILNWCKQMERIFGKGDFYLEMQPSANSEQAIVNRTLLEISNELNIPYIITTDSHYCKKEDAGIHAAFLNSQDGDREVASFYATTYMMGTEELENYMYKYSLFSPEVMQKAYENIIGIKNKCEDYSLLRELKIPSLKWRKPSKLYPEKEKFYINKMPYLKTFKESDFDGDKLLVDLIIDKIESDPKLQNDTIYTELNDNLKITWISSQTNKTHWSAYFLNLQNIIDTCWNAGSLVGPGRGSGVGFLLLYILDIIQINPCWEETKTFSWRFLNPDRVSVLDIDTDIEGQRRGAVLQALRQEYGEDRVSNVVTFGTEKSKSAIQTACRGLGIDNDIALYVSSLVPADRGQLRSLKECYYGDTEKGFKPIPLFVKEMNANPELWNVAQKIEGLVCRIGEHAGGIIFVDEPFTNSTALMRVPNGDIVTQFDLHDSEEASLIKIDLLSIEGLDKIHNCLDLLLKDGRIKDQGNIRATYEKYLGIYNLERDDPKMWDMVCQHKIESLFQMEQQSGIRGIALSKPRCVNDLCVLNSVIRLMAPEQGAEQPLEMWARYRRDITQWYAEMKKYGLTPDEIQWLAGHSAFTNGICESQEGLMSLVQEDRLGGNSLTFADKCRKGLAKKIGSLFDECEKEFYKNIEEKHCSEKLAHYVWDVALRVQRGYSFNRSHCLAYSLVALQEMNLAFMYPITYWNCACLISNSGGTEETSEDSKGTNYKKMATAIGKMRNAGIKIAPPSIDNSQYTFAPDVDNNQILFGLNGLVNVGTEVVDDIINDRPYSSVKDFYYKVKPTKQAMVSLIKSGAFDEFDDRKFVMAWYIWETCDKKSRLTLQNMPSLIKRNMIPQNTEDEKTALSIYEFNRYLKKICKKGEMYVLDERAINFLNKMEYDNIILVRNNIPMVDPKTWDKIYQMWMDVFREWIKSDGQNILKKLNYDIFMEDWKKYALGSISKWEMASMCYYYHEHELANVNFGKYGIQDFFKLPEEPIVAKTFERGGKEVKLFELTKICGTCIAKDKAKSTVSLLTTTGVVLVKFNKEYFSMFDRQISQPQSDGTKKIIEKSWFNRGNMILVNGMRQGDTFISKKYSTTRGHQLYKIIDVNEDGDIILQTERAQGELEVEED